MVKPKALFRRLVLAVLLACPYSSIAYANDELGEDSSWQIGDSAEFLSDEASQFDESQNDEFGIQLTDFQQPSAPPRPTTGPRRPTRVPSGQNIAPPSSADTGDYLASAPRMFGHYYGATGQLQIRSIDPFGKLNNLVTDVPMAGGASPLQITDNNSPLPQSRFFVNYNHFENALRVQGGAGPTFLPIDQYTVGTEQTLMDGIASWQIQLPMTSGFGVGGNPGVSAGQFGNLGFIAKAAVWRSDYAILSSGLGLDLPTGSRVQGQGQFTGYQLRNTATTMLPYIGVMALPTDDTFFQGFVTATVPANGNQFMVLQPGAKPQSAGYYNAQTRLHFDLLGGLWLSRNPGGGGLTGLAFLSEIHYVAATQHGDSLNFTSNGPTGPTDFRLGNISNQQTATNFTVGLHTVWNDRFQFRIGGAFPLAQRPNRNFDGEVIAQMNFIP
jgi:hypothetical protein